MQIDRPLSPHIIIYKPQLTSILSILHRISGTFLAAALLIGILFLKVGHFSLIFESYYQCAFFVGKHFHWFILGLVNFIFLALSYHMSNGVRHLWQDFGFILDLSQVYISGIVMLLVAVFLTFLKFIQFSVL